VRSCLGVRYTIPWRTSSLPTFFKVIVVEIIDSLAAKSSRSMLRLKLQGPHCRDRGP